MLAIGLEGAAKNASKSRSRSFSIIAVGFQERASHVAPSRGGGAARQSRSETRRAKPRQHCNPVDRLRCCHPAGAAATGSGRGDTRKRCVAS